MGGFGDPGLRWRSCELTDALSDEGERVVGAFMAGVDVTERLRG